MSRCSIAFTALTPLQVSKSSVNFLNASKTKCPVRHNADNCNCHQCTHGPYATRMANNNPDNMIASTCIGNQDRRNFLRLVFSTTAVAIINRMTPKNVQATTLNVSNRIIADSPAVVNSISEARPLSGDYKTDASLVLTDMRVACALTRGAPNMEQTVLQVRREMNDFVALYRRNKQVSGNPSFSTLYTAINTLSGHYANYGNSYPVPEKRKKRLLQQFTEVDRALSRGR